MHGKWHLTLEALPPELRAGIYKHLFSDLSIVVTREGILNTSQYRHQISAVSKLLRNETLPLLRDTTSNSHLRLLSQHGRFPEHIRRRLPTHVCRSIRVITILDQVEYDDVKPTLATFPNLLRLEFDLYKVKQDHTPVGDMICAYDTNDDVIRCENSLLMYHLCELQRDQERPGEGLERDYLPENTLWQVCRASRARRGFDVSAQLRMECAPWCGCEKDFLKTMTLPLAKWGVEL